jgi:hypothetical protein
MLSTWLGYYCADSGPRDGILNENNSEEIDVCKSQRPADLLDIDPGFHPVTELGAAGEIRRQVRSDGGGVCGVSRAAAIISDTSPSSVLNFADG